ncbi:MAG TPA: acyl-CoA dehydrogenase, partial [Acidimicrobiales bacterium]|nr:acyl-CoA dehydrogenase [Acidimicrobiales bacterium]
AGVFRERWDGGYGGGIRSGLAIADECAKTSMSVSLGTSLHCEVFCSVLDGARSKSAISDLFEQALAGSIVGCVGSTEPQGGSDLSSIQTTAIRSGDMPGSWAISGTKWFTSNGSIATHAAILANVQDGQGSGSGPTVFVVPMDMPGVTRLCVEPTMGVVGCETSGIRLDLVGLPDDLRIGRVGLGLLTISKALQMERLVGAWQVIAIAKRASQLAASFMRDRSQFGGALVAKQALRHRMAEARTKLLAVECLIDKVSAEIEAGRSVGHETAATKLLASRVAAQVVDDALQMAGGRGYLEAFPFERWLRDVRLARIGGGTDEVMMDIVARELDTPDPFFDEWMDKLNAMNLFAIPGKLD